MIEGPEKIFVQVKYKDVQKKFSAEPQEVWLLLNQFFKDFIPSLEIAQKLWLNIDVTQLAKELNGILTFQETA